MSEKTTITCNGCRREPINDDYTLLVHVQERLPEGGGISTGFALNERYDFCQECKAEVTKELLAVLRLKRGGKDISDGVEETTI